MNNPGDWNEWSRHVLAELKRLDKSSEHTHTKLDKFFISLEKYNETLIRNTVTLEEHVKRTNLLESKVGKVEKEVDGLKAHIDSVKKMIGFISSLFSTKGRFMIKFLLTIVVLLLGYHFGLKDLVVWFLKIS